MKFWLALFVWLGVTSVAQAHTHLYEATLTWSEESIPNTTLAIGTSTVTLDLDLITLRLEIQFSGLSGQTTEAFLHGVTLFANTGFAGPMSPALSASGFPLGVGTGSYDHTFDLTDAAGYHPTFLPASAFPISDALTALANGFEEGKVYLSIKSTAFPSGEIRGFFAEVPETGSASFLAATGVALLARRSRHHRTVGSATCDVPLTLK